MKLSMNLLEKASLSDYTEMEFIQAIGAFNSMDIEWTENQTSLFVSNFDRIVKHPKQRDLLFDPSLPHEDTPQGITNEIKRWYKEQGLPCFKDD